MAPADGTPAVLGPLGRTTAFRLALLYVAFFVTAAALAAVLFIWQTNTLLTEQVLRALRSEREELVTLAEARGHDALAAAIAERSRSGMGTLYFLGDARGARIAGNLSRQPAELQPGHPGGLFTYAGAASAEAPQRLAAGMMIATAGDGTLVLARDVEDQKALIQRLRRVFLWSLGALALAGIAGGIAASRALLNRIAAVSAASSRIMAGELGRRIPLSGADDEIDDLARHLNVMLERIEQLMGGLREVSDNIAHDLKTPLNRLRSRAEAALRDERGAPAWREGLDHCIEEADELIRTFNALLLIAKLEAGAIEESATTFDLGAVVRDVAELYEPVAEEAGLSLAVAPSAGPMLRANRELIGQAVANLVDNAIKYGALPATREPVRIGILIASDAVEICVADRGPGIRDEDRARALRRFVRLDTSRTLPGTGLGLSLVIAVARLHGGSVRLDDNKPGLAATLVLPSRLVVSTPAGGTACNGSTVRDHQHAGSS